MIAAAAGVLGALAGFGLLLALDGLFPAAQPLAEQARRLHRSMSVAAPGRSTLLSAYEVLAVRPRSARPAVDRTADLAMTGCSRRRWLRWRAGAIVISMTMASIAGAVAGLITAAIASDAEATGASGPALASAAITERAEAAGFANMSQQPGVAHLAVWVTASALGGMVMAWVGAEQLLIARARSSRSAFQAAVACYLELVAVALAGGSGPAEAMRAASSIGDGWAFRSIRAAIAKAELQQCSPYRALHELGIELGVTELSEVGSALALAEQQGAPIKSMLEAKSRTVTSRLLSSDQAEAETRSVAMSLPSVLMLSGFLLFLMYPFVAGLLATTA